MLCTFKTLVFPVLLHVVYVLLPDLNAHTRLRRYLWALLCRYVFETSGRKRNALVNQWLEWESTELQVTLVVVRLLSVLGPRWRNELHHDVRTSESLTGLLQKT